MSGLKFKSKIECPLCNNIHTEKLDLDYKIIIYICNSCGHTLTIEDGYCCIFCKYGSIPCIDIQTKEMEDN